MRIRTSGVPKDLQRITKEGVKFFCENFLHPKTYANIEEIKICFVERKGTDIACAGPEDAEEARPRLFTIEFNKLYLDIRIREYLVALFHELTHVRQFATGQLRDLQDGSTNWRGKNYPEDTPYWLQPWELEAQGMEKTVEQMFHAARPEWNIKSRFPRKYNGRAGSGWTGKPLPKQ